MKLQTNEERLNFLKMQKTRFRKNFDFRALCVYLSTPVNKHESDFRSSRPEVFCKKGVLRYF